MNTSTKKKFKQSEIGMIPEDWDVTCIESIASHEKYSLSMGPFGSNITKDNFIHQDVIEFEDTGVVVIEFKNGILGTINYTVNSYNKNMEGSITLFGEKGTVKVGGQYINSLEYQSIQDYKITNIEESRPANDYGFYQGSMSNHDKVYENVRDVLTKNGVIATTGEEGLKTVEIIEKIYHSAKMNKNKHQ